MAARRRDHKTKDLPPNLYCRGGYYSYRDPRTGKEYGLGRDKRFAVNEAVAANMEMMPAKVSLVDKINGKEVVLFDALVEAYENYNQQKELTLKTQIENKKKVKAIVSHFSNCDVSKIDTKAIANFLDQKISEGKLTMANLLRSTLIEIFKVGIMKGLVKTNPATSTSRVRVKVEKERLTIDEYLIIRKSANKLDPIVGLIFDLAVVTGQRASDLSKMKWSDIKEEALYVVQGKTNCMLKISVKHRLNSINLTISNVLENISKISGTSDFILGGKGQPDFARYFRQARDISGIKWSNSPPPFHELRSLSGRLYAEEKGREFAQKILGHKSSAMTEKYIDGRGKDWLNV